MSRHNRWGYFNERIEVLNSVQSSTFHEQNHVVGLRLGLIRSMLKLFRAMHSVSPLAQQ